MDGICTLANDLVFDNVVALLNSIEHQLGRDFPVCIVPYDDRLDQIRAELNNRPQVRLYHDERSIQKWDAFAKAVWDSHPTARSQWQAKGKHAYHRLGTHRRFCAFDGPFDRFLYMDADTLLLGDVAPIVERLEQCDWVVYDFQHKDPSHVFNLQSNQLNTLFSPERIQREIFCSGFYAAKKGLFSDTDCDRFLTHLRSGEAEILYPFAPDQTLLNYMVMRSQRSVCNLALQLSADAKTGNSVTSTHFQLRDLSLFDHDKPLIYLHYIGVPAILFQQICQGVDVDIPYRELFLRYRYLNAPEQRPVLKRSLIQSAMQPLNRLWKR